MLALALPPPQRQSPAPLASRRRPPSTSIRKEKLASLEGPFNGRCSSLGKAHVSTCARWEGEKIRSRTSMATTPSRGDTTQLGRSIETRARLRLSGPRLKRRASARNRPRNPSVALQRCKRTSRFYPKSTFGFFFAIERSRSAALRGFRDPCSQLCTAL